MKADTKQAWMDVAEIIDSWRTYPRMLLSSYWWLIWKMCDWYFRLPSVERTVDVTAFTAGVFGMATYATKIYLDGGRDWDKYRADSWNQTVRDCGSHADHRDSADVGGAPRASG